MAREPVLAGDYVPEFWDLHPDGDRVLVAQSESADGGETAARFILVTNWFTELRERLGN